MIGSVSTAFISGSDRSSLTCDCRSAAVFASCTLNNSTRPPPCRANAAAYFSAACAFAEKSVGNKIFRNGNIIRTLSLGLNHLQDSDFHAKLRKLSLQQVTVNQN